MSLTITPLAGIPFVTPGMDIVEIILSGLKISHIQLQDNDIVAIAQKIVSKAEGRQVNLASVVPSERASLLANEIEKDPRLVELILRESREVIRTRPGTIIVEHKLGFICANAGIDHSNVSGEGNATDDMVLLLPENPDLSASKIRESLEQQTGVKLGVLINDSHGRAWRMGTVGSAIGLSGIPGVLDERGWKDLTGYTLRITVVGIADEIAAAASLQMGQAAEGTPIVHIRGFPYPLRNGNLSELLRPKDQDMFR